MIRPPGVSSALRSAFLIRITPLAALPRALQPALALALFLATPHFTAIAARAEQPTSLDSLLAFALERHPTILAARARREAAGAGIGSAASAWFPSFTAGPSASQSRSAYLGTRTTTTELNAVDLSVEQMLWDFGRSTARVRAAMEAEALARSQEEVSRAEIAQAVVEKYVEAVYTAGLVELRSRTYEDRILQRDRVAKLVERGVRPYSDSTRAEIDLGNVRLDLDASRSALIIALEKLRDAAGVETPPGTPSGEFLSISPRLPLTRSLREDAVTNRPEIIAARVQTTARRAEAKAELGENMPRLTAAAALTSGERSVAVTDPTGSARTTGRPFDEWSVRVGLGWSDWNPAERRSAYNMAVARIAEADADLVNKTRQIEVELAIAVETLKEAIGRVRNAESVREAASENLDLIRRRYNAGAASILEITDGQVRLTESEGSVLRARADVWIANARLRRAAGMPPRSE